MCSIFVALVTWFLHVICLEEEAFYALIEKTVECLREGMNNPKDKWISDKEAMQVLQIKSRTTLQKLRDEGKIRFSQPQKKIILYDRESRES